MTVTLQRPPVNSGYYEHAKFSQYDIGDKGFMVFGSNLMGIHGIGAAKAAVQRYGARWGQGTGHQGRSYALPTKASPKVTLPLKDIRVYVEQFKWFAEITGAEDGWWFYVTAIATGYAGYRHEEIAPLFRGTPHCWFPDVWRPWLGDSPGQTTVLTT